MTAIRTLALIALLEPIACDVYMQYPPGSNNRLDEGGGNRNNNNRLMDTQNNAKGGYGYGGSANNKAAPVKYMAGSKLSMTWTSQHSCGSENAECQIVIQYMCNEGSTTPGGPYGAAGTATGIGEGPLRDGSNNNAPNPNAPDANRGLHEPTSFYQACAARERNKGLYVADQNLNNNDATRTRQNPNGARSGLECPEERDYYPYWAPSPWKDLMVMTNNLAQCDFYQKNSQNVMPRGVCVGSGANQGSIPNNPGGCAQEGGTWTPVPAWGIPAPACVAAPVTRDNHLGNDRTGNEVTANLTIPYGAGGLNVDESSKCVMRLRYNITTADTRACSLGKGAATATRATCEAAGGIWSAFYLNSDYDDSDLSDTPPLPDGNPTVSMGGFLKSSNGGSDSLLELAINTNQYGRTFQDRTHEFSVEERPASIAKSTNIYNLNVKGKRGNIVQTYPATEYDFHPVDLVVGSADLVHIQWTGNDNTNNNGNNNGEGTNDEDRHNIVQLDNSGLDIPMYADQANMFDVAMEWNPDTSTEFGGPRLKDALTKQFALSKQTNCAQNPNNDQQRDNCEKLNSAAATVNLGLLKFRPGSYKYMSSRNNNFSNRAQKAKVTILDTPQVVPEPPVNVTAEPIPSLSKERASVRVTWAPPGDRIPYIGTDGKQYVGKAQEDALAIAYTVAYSYDGGASWLWTSGCSSTVNDCDPPPPEGMYCCNVHNLPAGTPTSFKVYAGSSGGLSDGSEPGVVRTIDSDASAACSQQLIDQVNGNFLSPGATAAIVIGVLAAVLLTLCLGWTFLCGGKEFFGSKFGAPPPPPPPKFETYRG